MKPMNGRPLTEVFSDSSGVLSPRPDREMPPSIHRKSPPHRKRYLHDSNRSYYRPGCEL